MRWSVCNLTQLIKTSDKRNDTCAVSIIQRLSPDGQRTADLRNSRRNMRPFAAFGC